MKVFLGGTCNDSQWRNQLIPHLKCDYFNPVVDDWTPECQAEELLQRKNCDYVLYVITPAMVGVYSIAEAVDDSNKRPNRTIFCYLSNDTVGVNKYSFGTAQLKSLDAVAKLITANGGLVYNNLAEVANLLNGIQQGLS